MAISLEESKSCTIEEKGQILDSVEANILKYAIASDKLTNQLTNLNHGRELLELTTRCLIEADSDVQVIRDEVLKPRLFKTSRRLSPKISRLF